VDSEYDLRALDHFDEKDGKRAGARNQMIPHDTILLFLYIYIYIYIYIYLDLSSLAQWFFCYLGGGLVATERASERAGERERERERERAGGRGRGGPGSI